MSEILSPSRPALIINPEPGIKAAVTEAYTKAVEACGDLPPDAVDSIVPIVFQQFFGAHWNILVNQALMQQQAQQQAVAGLLTHGLRRQS